MESSPQNGLPSFSSAPSLLKESEKFNLNFLKKYIGLQASEFFFVDDEGEFVEELRRFLVLKVLAKDMDASILSPSAFIDKVCFLSLVPFFLFLFFSLFSFLFSLSLFLFSFFFFLFSFFFFLFSFFFFLFSFFFFLFSFFFFLFSFLFSLFSFPFSLSPFPFLFPLSLCPFLLTSTTSGMARIPPLPHRILFLLQSHPPPRYPLPPSHRPQPFRHVSFLYVWWWWWWWWWWW